LLHPHVVRLETRPASAEGTGEITLAQLLRTALRMRPDRLVLGEVRGAEAVQLVQAMNTGHDGSMSTVHANSTGDALARLCSLVLQEVPGWPLGAIHDQVRRSIDVVVHVGRSVGNERQVIEVCESDPAVTGVQLRCLVERGSVIARLKRRRR
jgi:pilus assembly protein CpaF